VTFKKRIENLETMFDEGCRATISLNKNHTDHDCICLTCDFSKYEDYNMEFYQPNYYDKNGEPCLKVYETNCYPKNKKEDVWFDWNDEVIHYFSIDSETKNELYEEYTTSRVAGESYVSWLEKRVMELRK